jgi:hypothetical protein
MTDANDTMNGLIRRRMGRTEMPAPETRDEIAAAATEAAEKASPDADLREQVAQRLGLPAGTGKRLVGETAEELVDDAIELRTALGGIGVKAP